MGIVNSLEPRLRWISFPGLIRGIVILHFFTFFLLALRPEALNLFLFDWDKILAGEAWRLVTFIFVPPILPIGMISYVFIFFFVLIGFLIGDSLEHAWGSFRSSVFCYGVIFCQVLANVLFHKFLYMLPVPQGGAILNMAFFFAFATMFPNHEFRIMFIIPVKVYLLAILSGLGMVLLVLMSGIYAPIVGGYLLVSFFSYLVWAAPIFLKFMRNRTSTAHRRAVFHAKQVPLEDSFHTCASCGATEHTHPDREFRITEEDDELCEACLPEQS